MKKRLTAKQLYRRRLERERDRWIIHVGRLMVWIDVFRIVQYGGDHHG